MSVRVNTNVAAMNAQRNLGMTATIMGKSVERLSSGLRVSRAADDAAGLAISEKLRAQVRGLNQAQRNAQDGISMVQTAEGALNEVHSMLQRMRELAVQASNSTLGASDRSSINDELVQLRAEINRISTSTKFDGQQLLAGRAGSVVDTSNPGLVQPGQYLGHNITVTAMDVSEATPNLTYGFNWAGGPTNVILNASDGRSQTVTVADMNAGESQVLNYDQLGLTVTATASAWTSATDVGTAFLGAAFRTLPGTLPSWTATFQVGANAGEAMATSFGRVDLTDTSSPDGLGTLVTALTNYGTTQSTTNAQALITAADDASATVSTTRGGLGTVQNRLEHSIASLSVASENLTASESRIRDVDVAAEMVTFTRSQILQQAGTSILAQANQAPSTILALLR